MRAGTIEHEFLHAIGLYHTQVKLSEKIMSTEMKFDQNYDI